MSKEKTTMSYQEFFTQRNIHGKTEELNVEGVPVPFILKTITNAEFTDCQHQAKNDAARLNEEICLRGIKEPCFLDQSFIAAMGCATPHDALRKSLLSGEIMYIAGEILKFNGFDLNLGDKIKVAKN